MLARQVRRGRHSLPKFVATAAALGMVLATPLGGDVLRSSVQAAQRAADLIDARSPGLRSETGLIKSKRRTEIATAAVDSPRTAPALSGARAAPVAAPVETAPAMFVPAVAETGPAGGLFPASIPPGGGAFFGGPGGGFVSFAPVGSPGGGPGGGGGVVIAPPEEGGTVPGPPVVTPVPEPATWLMMILGFGALGSALRWRSRDGYRAI